MNLTDENLQCNSPRMTAFLPGFALSLSLILAIGAQNAFVLRQGIRQSHVGAVVLTPIGILSWEPMTTPDWGWMITLCITGAFGHFTLIKAYEQAEASAVQPFAYLQLVFASGVGVLIFDEVIEMPVAIGAGVVVAAGLFTLWRERQNA